MSEASHVKVRFELPHDGEGWPPTDVEGMWAVPISQDHYRIDNIPFYARGVSDGDIVTAFPNGDARLVFQAVVEPSEFSTIRIAVTDESEKQSAREIFKAFGCDSEGMNGCLFALSIPRRALGAAMNEIRSGESAGRWDWEEGVIRA